VPGKKKMLEFVDFADYREFLVKNKNIAVIGSSLNSKIPEERMHAVRSLGMLTSVKRAPSGILKALKDKDELVRIEASESLGNLGDRRSLPFLRKTLDDRSPLVRRYAAIAIGKIGLQVDIATISAKCQQDQNPVSRVGYWQALYMLRKPGALEKLLGLLKYRDYRIRCAAAHALEVTGCSDSDRVIAIRILKKMYEHEPTMAAQSSIQSSLRLLKKNNPPLEKRGRSSRRYRSKRLSISMTRSIRSRRSPMPSMA
jgi:HEAT repeats